MKIKNILFMLLIMLLPIVSIATDNRDEASICADIIYDEVFPACYHSRTNSPVTNYILGVEGQKGIYKQDIVNLCNKKNDCDQAEYGKLRIDVYNENRSLNMIALSTYMNNFEVVRALFADKPEMKPLIDTGLYAPEPKKSNNRFYTPALLAVELGQLGVLKKLDKEYHVNLFKEGGWIDKFADEKDQVLRGAQRIAKSSVKRWKRKIELTDDPYTKEKYQKMLNCAKLTQEYVDQWFEDHKNDQAKLKEAREYNAKLQAIASMKENMVQTVEPFEFVPENYFIPLRLNIDDSYAQYIQDKIESLINNIMQNLEKEFASSDINNMA